MPGLARKLLICAAVDGLLIHPVNEGRAQTHTSVRIEYGTNNISCTAEQQPGGKDEPELEAHGIIGLLNLVSSSYLISVTRREQVALIRERPIFAIRDVTLIPLSSRRDAEHAIVTAQRAVRDVARKIEHGAYEQHDENDLTTVVSDAESINEAATDQDDAQHGPEGEAAALEAPSSALKKSVTAATDTAAGQASNIGKHAQKWFSRGEKQGQTPDTKLTVEQKRQETEALPTESDAVTKDKSGDDDGQGSKRKAEIGVRTRPVIESLTPRILRSARLFFGSSGLYFSYDHDLSHKLGQNRANDDNTPLWSRFDSLFLWNRHLLQPFIEAKADDVVLPLIQGFIGQRSFSIAKRADGTSDAVTAASDITTEVKYEGGDEHFPEHKPGNTSNFLLTLISRRSIKRAGLRYLRRGVDEAGYVANNVETEQILSADPWNEQEKASSLLQVRGSIPLFFSQSPYSFKPLPVMFGSEITNQNAIKKHFSLLSKRYGQVQIASLVDKHATEVKIGEAYEQQVKTYNDGAGPQDGVVGFEWFDFHSVCKGMKFENVSVLLDTLRSQLSSFGWTVTQNDVIVRKQSGILRTNCMDCLDRTNVVQSAVAGWALQQQLSDLGLEIDLQKDPKTQWFNTLWADNGDAISKQYAGTSALKGDFTRTRKRNWTGALSDFSLTLNRYYNNIFGDYFLQTCIDYYLGNAGPEVFTEFEADMMAQDYALDMKHVRQNAIETCQNTVLTESAEELVAGWTLSCPRQSGTLRSLPFEECVLLLTQRALYFCRFDWTTEKIGGFEKIELEDITEIWRGAYVTSTLRSAHLDEGKNTGFALKYSSAGLVLVERNIRTIGNDGNSAQANVGGEQDRTKASKDSKPKHEGRILAFKILPLAAVTAKDDKLDLSHLTNEDGIAKHISEAIQTACTASINGSSESVDASAKPLYVQKKDIISAAEAKQSTSYVESLGYSLKKMVWS